MTTQPIAIVGAGSWGTALAVLLAAQGHEVRLWGRDSDAIAAMARERCNRRYLADVALPHSLLPTCKLEEAVAGAGEILLAVPSHAFVQSVVALSGICPRLTALAWASKGVIGPCDASAVVVALKT